MSKQYTLDFKKVSAEVDIDKLAAFLGLVLVKREGPHQLRYGCPMCDRDRTLCINSEIREWKCHGCQKKGGDLVALAAAVRGIGQYLAAKLIATELLGAPTTPADAGASRTAPQNEKRRANAATAFYPDKYLSELDAEAPEIAYLGLNPEMLKVVGGYRRNGTLQNTLAIALRKPTGETIGYVGISLSGEPPKFPKNFK
jgi:hypothetical protein